MRCPNCATVELVRRKVVNSDVMLDVCPQCKGLWFQRGQLERVLPKAVPKLAVPPDAKPGHRACPACQQPMHAFDYPGTLVVIDMCQSCLGLWVDAGELREIRVVRAALASKGDLPPSGLKAEILDLVDQAMEWAIHW